MTDPRPTGPDPSIYLPRDVKWLELLRRLPLIPFALVGANQEGLINERKLTAGSGVSFTDTGPGGELIIASSASAGFGGSLNIQFGNGSQALTTADQYDHRFYSPYTLVDWAVYAPTEAGTITFDIQKSLHSIYPSYTSMVGAGIKPFLATGRANAMGNLNLWTTSMAAGEIMRVKVTAITALTTAVIALKFQAA